MTSAPRKFNRITPDQRKLALIEATLALVGEKGVQGATVRAIADRADVTQGLIRHHFSSKEELISAAYDHHMTTLTTLAQATVDPTADTARSRLAGFVRATLTPPVVDQRSLALWAAFLNRVQQDAAMRAIHQRTYMVFRDHLEGLIHAALTESNHPAPQDRTRRLAIACNAVLDGLWLEGGALPNLFAPDELSEIGLASVGALINIDLKQKAE
ncbi:TetR family transcriptional regulator C-terminal domain-containing protein [Rhodobacteraceae bacterium M382]|nr:TetR family transcriptional regulator C-terminal domain-containing protein [Rhodobacteraceae bacterium M382]